MAQNVYGTLYPGSAAGPVNAVLFVMDVGDDLSAVGIQVVSAGVATVTYECSNDQTTWYAVMGFDPTSATPAWAATTNALGIRVFPVQGFKFFRARISAYTSGTVTINGLADSCATAQGPVTGSLSLSAAIPAGANTIGATFPAVVATANGLTIHKLLAAATTNATLVASGVKKLTGGHIYNLSAATKFVKLFNKATAPVPGTDTPVMVLAIAANTDLNVAQICDQFGISFPLGLGYAITGAVADLDATAVAAGDVILNLLYI